MAYRSRCTLHINSLTAFSDWLESQNWKPQKPKGDYEVLRMKKDGEETLIVHKKLDSKEHLTTHGISQVMVNKWIRSRDVSK